MEAPGPVEVNSTLYGEHTQQLILWMGSILILSHPEGQIHAQMANKIKFNYNSNTKITNIRDTPGGPMSGDQEDCATKFQRTPTT